jgi:DNA uptake protein ComE-like DNA-binding protein
MNIRSILGISGYSDQSRFIKLKQIPVLGMLLAVLILSSCSSKSDSSSTTSPSTEKSSETSTAPTTGKIDVNSASIAELDKLELPGTKPSLSERIQGKRPYSNADDLITKKAISADEYKLIKDLIVVGKAK